MFYPFVTHSLTRKFERRIHQALRQDAPLKYWTFRISAYLERAGFFLGLMCLGGYFIGYEVLRYAGQLESSQLAQYTDLLVRTFVVSGAFSICGAFLQFTLFRELEPVVERAVRGLCAERSD